MCEIIYDGLHSAVDIQLLIDDDDECSINQKSRVFLVDIIIPPNENLVKAETEKKHKYLDLSHEFVELLGVESAEIISYRNICQRF
ncbi:unnamed protein product [Euphydryas editha]|uniref:Uncharacterized protein n=1 Tax=Euphydryas editha TaxID=104508 RepID=A0AAU9V8I9_EUPED|nr:unnamed protein product [Euphydryas editha]